MQKLQRLKMQRRRVLNGEPPQYKFSLGQKVLCSDRGLRLYRAEVTTYAPALIVRIVEIMVENLFLR